MTNSHVAAGQVVSIHYTLKLDNGEVVDSSEGQGPLEYLHGAANIVPGLERALNGLAIGDLFQVTVSAEDGYGEHDTEAEQTVQRAMFPKDVKLEAGMQFAARGDDGQPMPFTITEVEGDTVQIDFNHPLAGETLHFSGSVVAIRAATQEETQHGHPHGPGGHHHHGHDH